MNARSLRRPLLAGILSIAGPLSTPGSSVPTGVPEPGIVLWGRVVSAGNPAVRLPIESVRWEVSDGTRVATFDAASRPATRIRRIGGEDYYVVEIPFDTRRLSAGSAGIALDDPALSGRPSFELQPSTPPTYRCVATINGSPASVQAVDSVPLSGLLPAGFEAPNFSLTTRGRVIRVDLSIALPGTSYDNWATRIWGSPDHPNAAPALDPDGDGVPNSGEFEAGTDPLDPDSVLRILALTLSPETSTVTVSWQSVAERTYRIESAQALSGPGAWTVVRDELTGLANRTASSLPFDPSEPGHFFRVRVVPQPSSP